MPWKRTGAWKPVPKAAESRARLASSRAASRWGWHHSHTERPSTSSTARPACSQWLGQCSHGARYHLAINLINHSLPAHCVVQELLGLASPGIPVLSVPEPAMIFAWGEFCGGTRSLSLRVQAGSWGLSLLLHLVRETGGRWGAQQFGFKGP